MKLAAPLVIALLAACGSDNKKAAEPAPPPDPAAATAPAGPPAPAEGEVDPEWKRMGDMAVDLMRKLHAVTTANANNCDAMADGLVTMVDENKTFIAEANSFQGNAEFNAWFGKTYQAELAELLREIQPALMGCKDNAKVQEAFKKLQS